MPAFAQCLLDVCESAQSLLCVGLDVDLARLPVATPLDFNRAIVDATADLVCAYKPNLAFYEALGVPGMLLLERTVAHIRDVAPSRLIIGDCKRGDVGGSAGAYAAAMFDVWGFDAVTVNPWGGMDTLEPWLDYAERGVFVWCRGSNPGAFDLQDLPAVDACGDVQSACIRVAQLVRQRSASGNLGLVVGATEPRQLAAVREVCPDLPLLVPGVGAQGGDLAESVRCGVDRWGRMAVVSSTRSVIYASAGRDYAQVARRRAAGLRSGINEVLAEMGLGWR